MTGKQLEPAKPTTVRLLARLLDQPRLVQALQALPARALSKLIDHVGLEDAGELIALASTEQLGRVFEDDLFRSEEPGASERFDAARFPLWLAVLFEAGERFAAQKLAELPEDLLTLALHKHVLVVDVEALAVALANGGAHSAWLEKALESPLHHEIDQYRLFAREGEGWDAIIAALSALDREYHDLLERLLEHCCALSTDWIEDNGGLYEVLSSEDMLESDIGGEREERREREGFVAASDARAFLGLARSGQPAQGRDPITLAHFRALEASEPQSSQTPAEPAPTDASAEREAALAELVASLQAAEVFPAAAPPLLPAGDDDADPRVFVRALRELSALDPQAHAQRIEELAYLANVLLTGATLGERRFRPLEAGAAAVATCNLGLELASDTREERVSRASVRRLASMLAREHADRLFIAGYAALHARVVMGAADALRERLSRSPAQAGAEVDGFASELRVEVARGTPWVIRARLGRLEGVIEASELAALAGLFSECPTLAGALMTDGGTQAKRGGELEFIATRAELERACAFLVRFAAGAPAQPQPKPSSPRKPREKRGKK